MGHNESPSLGSISSLASWLPIGSSLCTCSPVLHTTLLSSQSRWWPKVGCLKYFIMITQTEWMQSSGASLPLIHQCLCSWGPSESSPTTESLCLFPLLLMGPPRTMFFSGFYSGGLARTKEWRVSWYSTSQLVYEILFFVSNYMYFARYCIKTGTMIIFTLQIKWVSGGLRNFALITQPGKWQRRNWNPGI